MGAPSAGSRAWRGGGIYAAVVGLLLIVIVQATLLSRIHFLGAQPDLLLVLVVCWSLFYGVGEGLLLAFAGGLALDIVAGLPLGSSPLALMPLCFLGLVGRSSIYVNNLWLPTLLVALGTPLDGMLMLFIRQLRGTPVDWLGAATHVILPAIGLNLVLTVLVARPLRRAAGRSRLEPVA